jgi:hypothetical protein
MLHRARRDAALAVDAESGVGKPGREFGLDAGGSPNSRMQIWKRGKAMRAMGATGFTGYGDRHTL